MAFTNYLEEQLLGHVFGLTTYTKPAGLFLALFTAAPGEAAGGTEVSTVGTAYARQPATFDVTPGNPSTAVNNAAIEYATATANYGTVTHVAIFDAATGGNMLSYAPLSVAKTIGTGDVFRVPAANLTFTLD